MRPILSCLTLILLLVHSAAHAQPAGISYTISVHRAPTQIIDVEATLEGIETEHVDFVLPTWRSGRYVVLDFAATVRDVKASDSVGSPIPVRKIDKTTWRVTTNGSSTVTLSYGVFADARGNRTRYLDATHCFIDASAVMVYNPERRQLPHQIKVDAPEEWDIVTGLSEIPGEPRTWTSPTYDVLADSPFEMGKLDILEFESNGIPHIISIWGAEEQGFEYDQQQIIDDFKLIADTQIEMFGTAPYDRYVFMLHVYPGGGGGTEHLNSTIMGASPEVFTSERRYLGLLGLVAHELFHTWNVKHFRPAGITPYDFVGENYTPSLWIAEGTTSYYDELLLARTGQMELDTYINRVASSTGSTRNKFARQRQSLSESSWDAWIHLFSLIDHADARNTQVNFYGRGALASLALDLHIRGLTENEGSMDDVMRLMYERHHWVDGGYTPEDFRAIASEVAQTDLSDWFTAHIDGTEPLPLEHALEQAGLSLRFDQDEHAFIGIRTRQQNGLRVVTGIDENGPAFGSGLVAGDEIVALGSERAGQESPEDIASRLSPGSVVVVLYFRHNTLRAVPITIEQSPYGSYSVEPVSEPTEIQQRIFESWTSHALEEL